VNLAKQQINSIFKNYRWLLHLGYWSILVALLFLQLKTSGVSKYPLSYIKLILLIRLIIIILLSYSFLFFVIPLYKASSRLRFWFSMAGLILFWFILQMILIKEVLLYFPAINKLPEMQIMEIASRYSFNFVALFAFFIAFYYFVDIYDRQRELQLLAKFKREKIMLESSFLKSQVNPHFLFNTLNNIYALSLKKSDQAPVIIDRLESLLHYMLYECKADMVLLADEFTFTNSYIALEKLRHRDDQCIVTINIEGDVSNQYIAPLLLINFLENAFKHGTKTSFGKSWISMNVTVNKDSMHFNLQNSKPLMVGNRQPIAEYKGGIGLKNVKRRLEILYPGKHELLINDIKDRFEVDLILNF
jgi:two-component system LytT family sensor kinase